MTKGDLQRMLNPRTIAVVGAREKKGSPGTTVLENLLAWPADRKIFPVNPQHEVVLGLTCYPKVTDVPEPIDLVIIVTPARTVPQIVEECGHAEVGGILIISSGFREVGEEGRRLEERVEEIRKTYGMRIIGPNCLGVIRPNIALNASILKYLPEGGNIAFITQSGALGGAIFDWATPAHAGFSTFASLGSMIDVDFGDLVDFLGTDPATGSIVLYMEEGVANPKKFVLSARAFARYKPIIVVKPGRFAEPPRAPVSRAGALVNEDQVYDAVFKRVGVVRVKEVADLFNAVRVLHAKHLPKGPRLAIVTNAIGIGTMAKDALLDWDGELAPISGETLQALEAFLPPYTSKDNPIDVYRDAEVERYVQAVRVCLNDPQVDGVLIIYTLQETPRPRELARAIIDIAKEAWKPLVTTWIGGREVQKGREMLFQNLIPTYETPEDAVKTYLYMHQYRRSLELQYETPEELPLVQAPPKNNLKASIRRMAKEGTVVLDEEESNRFLNTYGIPTPRTKIAYNIEEALHLAGDIGYPVVLKIVSPDILQRMDVGGVVTGIHSEEELREEHDRLLQRANEYAPGARITGIAIQKMIEKIDYEIFLGAKRDPVFGSVMIAGMGGVGIEIFRDFAIGLPPMNQALARRLLEETKVYKMIQGYGLKPPADLRQLEQIIVHLSNLIVDFPEILEMDINPLAIADGQVHALAARIVIDRESLGHTSSYPHLVITPYPTRYVTVWSSADGTEVILRPIKSEDEPVLREMLANLSEHALKERFFQIIKSISHEMLIKLCNVDYDREMAILAEIRDGGRKKAVGLGGLMIEPNFTAGEFNIVVHDQHQGKGLGYKLIDVLIGIAQEKGLEQIYGLVLAENRKMLRLCRKLGFSAHPLPDGITRMTLSLK